MPSFTVDALLRKKIFEDAFDRTVVAGLGGPWYWDPYDSDNNTSQETIASVDGSEAVFDRDIGRYESWGGFPLPLTGEAYFDFFAVDEDEVDETYGLLLDPWNYYGPYIERIADTDWEVSQFGSDTASTVSVARGVWHRLHAMWDGTTFRINVWDRSTPEPTSWQYEQPQIIDLTGTNAFYTPPLLDIYWAAETGTKIENVEIWSHEPGWWGFGGFQLDAVITDERGHFLIDAILRRTTTRTGTPVVPTVVAAASASSSSAVSNLSVNKPTGTAQNDVMYMMTVVQSTVDQTLPPSGWANSVINVAGFSGSNQWWLKLYTKTAGASEPSSYNVALSAGSHPMSLLIITVRGGAIIDGRFFYDNNPPLNEVYTDSLPLTAPGLLLDFMQSFTFGPANFTPPSGFTEADDRPDFFISQSVAYKTSLDMGGETGVLTGFIDNTDAGSPTRSSTLLLIGGGSGITLDSMFRKLRSGSITMSAIISDALRQRHIRDDTSHYGDEPDDVIVLAQALGVYVKGSPVHDLLVAVDQRITALEGA